MKSAMVMFVGLSIVLLTMTGCDLLGKPKKQVKAQNTAAQTVAAVTPQVVAAAAVAPAAVPGADLNQPLPAGVIARVGQWTLTKDQFNERVKGVKEMVKDFNEKDPEAKATLLNELVRQQLLIQEARRQNLQDAKEVRAAMEEFENTLLVQQIVTELTKNVTVAEAETKKYYEANPEEFKKPVEKQLREIVLKTQAEANDALVQALQGADFTQLAKDKSIGKTKENGGDLGFQTEAPFPAMAAAVMTLKKGGISSVFEGPEGAYIVKVEDIRGGEQVAFEEVKEDLLKFLKLRQQQQVLADKVKEVQQLIKVQVNEDFLKEATGE